MHAPANQPEFKATVDPAIEELNRIVEQAEALLRSLGEQTGDAADAVRERVNETLQHARKYSDEIWMKYPQQLISCPCGIR